MAMTRAMYFVNAPAAAREVYFTLKDVNDFHPRYGAGLISLCSHLFDIYYDH